MSKYDRLWIYISNKYHNNFVMTFEEIKNVLGFQIDHSFLNYKKELEKYGFVVGKISLKDKRIEFTKLGN